MEIDYKFIGQQVKKLRKHYSLSVKIFAEGCRLSGVTIFNLERGVKISEKSLSKVISVYGTTQEWLFQGQGEMLPQGEKELWFDEINNSSKWKDKTYQEMINKGVVMEREIEKLWETLSQVISGRTFPSRE